MRGHRQIKKAPETHPDFLLKQDGKERDYWYCPFKMKLTDSFKSNQATLSIKVHSNDFLEVFNNIEPIFEPTAYYHRESLVMHYTIAKSRYERS